MELISIFYPLYSILLVIVLIASQISIDILNVHAQNLSTAMLDTFSRTNGSIGGNWSGYTSVFSIVANQLDVSSGNYDTYIFWNGTSFGVDQEA